MNHTEFINLIKIITYRSLIIKILSVFVINFKDIIREIYIHTYTTYSVLREVYRRKDNSYNRIGNLQEPT